LDFELIADIATQYPRCSFIFVGSKGEGEKAADISLLERIPNVHFLGGKPYSSLPAFLKGFDVCLLPNRLNEYTKNMFPMKFFEYLAAGKPVVSTRLDAISEFGEYCYLSSDHKEFIANIEKALNENNSNLRAPRIALAQQYTWENRIKEMKSILGQKL
jgi:glycosyltransferase involved in cell wall biosynthesis